MGSAESRDARSYWLLSYLSEADVKAFTYRKDFREAGSRYLDNTDARRILLCVQRAIARLRRWARPVLGMRVRSYWLLSYLSEADVKAFHIYRKDFRCDVTERLLISRQHRRKKDSFVCAKRAIARITTPRTIIIMKANRVVPNVLLSSPFSFSLPFLSSPFLPLLFPPFFGRVRNQTQKNQGPHSIKTQPRILFLAAARKSQTSGSNMFSIEIEKSDVGIVLPI